MRKAAHVLSLVLHPVWMPTYALMIAFAADPHLTFAFTLKGQWTIVAMVLVMTALFPIASTLMLWRSGMVSKPAMPGRRERTLPYVLTLVYFMMTYYLLRRIPSHTVTLSIFTGIMASLAAVSVINLRWKVSLHMVGIGGLVGMLLALVIVHGAPIGWLPLVFLLAGALGSARLLVGDHSPAQVYTGALIGIAATFLCVIGRWYY